MIRAKEKEPLLLFLIMDPAVLSAIIAASAAVLINIITNAILSARQTTVLEVKIQQIENTLTEIKKLPDRVTSLETNMENVKDALKEMRLS